MAYYYPNFLIRLQGPDLAIHGSKTAFVCPEELLYGYKVIAQGIMEQHDFDCWKYLSELMEEKLRLGYRLSTLKTDWRPTHEITRQNVSGYHQDSFSIDNDTIYTLPHEWKMWTKKTRSLKNLKYVLFEVSIDSDGIVSAQNTLGFLSDDCLLDWASKKAPRGIGPKRLASKLKNGYIYKRKEGEATSHYFLHSMPKVEFDVWEEFPDNFEKQQALEIRGVKGCAERFLHCSLCYKDLGEDYKKDGEPRHFCWERLSDKEGFCSKKCLDRHKSDCEMCAEEY